MRNKLQKENSIRKAFRSINRSLASFGISIPTLLQSLAGRRLYQHDRRLFIQQMQSEAPEFPLGSPCPQYTDRFMSSEAIDAHYLNQDLLVAQKVLQATPLTHVDIGSRVDGFVTHVATFRPLKVIDIHPPLMTTARCTPISLLIRQPSPPTAPVATAVAHFNL